MINKLLGDPYWDKDGFQERIDQLFGSEPIKSMPFNIKEQTIDQNELIRMIVHSHMNTTRNKVSTIYYHYMTKNEVKAVWNEMDIQLIKEVLVKIYNDSAYLLNLDEKDFKDTQNCETIYFETAHIFEAVYKRMT